MQKMQRKFGRLPFMARTPNEADIESMLRDFTDSDQMLEKVSRRCLSSVVTFGPLPLPLVHGPEGTRP